MSHFGTYIQALKTGLLLCCLLVTVSVAAGQSLPHRYDSLAYMESAGARIDRLLAAGERFLLKPGELKNDMDSARMYFEQARQLAGETGLRDKFLNCQYFIARLHQELKMPWITAQMAPTLLPQQQVTVYNHLSIYYRVKPGEYADDLDSSLLFGHRSLAVARELKQEASIQSAASALAFAYLEQRQIGAALQLAPLAAPGTHVNILRQSGYLYVLKHDKQAADVDSADYCARESLRQAALLGVNDDPSVSYFVLASVSLDRDRPDLAKGYLPMLTANFKGNFSLTLAKWYLRRHGMHDSAGHYARLAISAYAVRKNESGIRQAEDVLQAVDHIRGSQSLFAAPENGQQRFRKLITLARQHQSGFPAFDVNQLHIAANYINRAMVIADSLQSDPLRIEAWTEMGKTMSMLNDAEKGRVYYEMAIAKYRQRNNHNAIGNLYLHFVNHIRRQRPNYGLVAEIFGKASYHYALSGATDHELLAGMEQASYLREDARPDEARAVLLRLSRKYERSVAGPAYKINHHLAQLAQLRGDLSAALRHALSGLKEAETGRDTLMQKTFLIRLADVYYDLGQFDKSIETYHQAITFQHRFGANYDYFAVLSLTEALIRHRTAAAALTFVRSIYRSDPPVDFYGTRILECAQALCYQALGQPEEAEKHFLTALKNIDILRVGDRFYSMVHFNAGRFYLEQQKYTIAADHLRKAIRFRPDIASISLTNNAHYMLFQCDSAMGNYKDAIGHYQLYKYFTDSLFNVAKSRQISELQIQYETEKKDQSLLLQEQQIRLSEQNIQLLTKQGLLQKSELQQAVLQRHQSLLDARQKDQDLQLKETNIAILTQTSQIQQGKLEKEILMRNVSFTGAALLLVIIGLLFNGYRLKQKHNRSLEGKQIEIGHKNQSLEKLLHEKEWLLKEIHHRVKNNLQIVMSLLNSQSAYLQNDAALVAIRNSQHRVQAISLIHKKLYQSDNVGVIYMPHYIHELVDYLADCFDTGRRIRFRHTIAQVHLDVSQAVPLGLILNEAVTNSIKYAFPGNREGDITIRFEALGDDRCCLAITDNGVGLPADFDPASSRSLGMSLMEGLSNELGGQFCIPHRQGTEIVVTFTIEHFARPEIQSTASLLPSSTMIRSAQ